MDRLRKIRWCLCGKLLIHSLAGAAVVGLAGWRLLHLSSGRSRSDRWIHRRGLHLLLPDVLDQVDKLVELLPVGLNSVF